MTNTEFLRKLSQEYRRHWQGPTGQRLESGLCSTCSGASFTYNNGREWSEDGVRGYRCNGCSTIKPDRLYDQ